MKKPADNPSFMSKAFFRQLFFAARTALFCGCAALFLAQSVQGQGITIPTNALPQGLLQQLPPGVTAAEAQRLLQQQQQQNPGSAPQAPAQPPGQQLYVSAAPAILQTTSALETLYSHRAGRKLTQFGYDLVGNGGTPWIFNSNGIQVPVGNGGKNAGTAFAFFGGSQPCPSHAAALHAALGALGVYLGFLAAPGLLAEINESWANLMLAACLICYAGFVWWVNARPKMIWTSMQGRPADPS